MDCLLKPEVDGCGSSGSSVAADWAFASSFPPEKKFLIISNSK